MSTEQGTKEYKIIRYSLWLWGPAILLERKRHMNKTHGEGMSCAWRQHIEISLRAKLHRLNEEGERISVGWSWEVFLEDIGLNFDLKWFWESIEHGGRDSSLESCLRWRWPTKSEGRLVEKRWWREMEVQQQSPWFENRWFWELGQVVNLVLGDGCLLLRDSEGRTDRQVDRASDRWLETSGKQVFLGCVLWKLSLMWGF